MIPFISSADLGFYINKDLSGSDLATIVCDAACQLIRDEIDQKLNYEEDDVVILDGNDRSLLILPEQPIVAVSEVSIDQAAALDPAGYRIVNDRSMLERLGGTTQCPNVWTRGTRVSITYNHGYAVTEDVVDEPGGIFRVPSSIRSIALDRAATGMVAGRTGVGGVRSETLGRYRYDLAVTTVQSGMVLSEEQCAALEKYMVWGT